MCNDFVATLIACSFSTMKDFVCISIVVCCIKVENWIKIFECHIIKELRTSAKKIWKLCIAHWIWLCGRRISQYWFQSSANGGAAAQDTSDPSRVLCLFCAPIMHVSIPVNVHNVYNLAEVRPVTGGHVIQNETSWFGFHSTSFSHRTAILIQLKWFRRINRHIINTYILYYSRTHSINAVQCAMRGEYRNFTTWNSFWIWHLHVCNAM